MATYFNCEQVWNTGQLQSNVRNQENVLYVLSGMPRCNVNN